MTRLSPHLNLDICTRVNTFNEKEALDQMHLVNVVLDYYYVSTLMIMRELVRI
jgi:hypothetical protein